VNEVELLRELMALAEQAGLTVRPIRGGSGGEGEPSATSAVCRVRGETWVVLASSDSAEARIAVLSEALRGHAAEWLENRYLPPALRQRLLPDAEGEG
jgi:hypothetical protein